MIVFAQSISEHELALHKIVFFNREERCRFDVRPAKTLNLRVDLCLHVNAGGLIYGIDVVH
jgi:hypothetical protein